MKQLFLSVLLMFSTGLATATPAPSLAPNAPAVAAKGYILQDFHSGHVLAEKNADERLEPASLTKLMTAYAVFHDLRSGKLQLSDTVRISRKAWRTPGSRMFVEVDTEVPVEDLLKGMIIQSGNDASVALAEHIAGSEETFALMMNEYARDLGMLSTHFVNATGLPDAEHYSTARDLALLTRALIREFPEYYRWYSEKSYTWNKIQQYNRNRLLWSDDSVDGVKTGHTDAAGYCLVSSAQRGDMRLISVIMGTRSEEARAQESLKLLNYGYRFFETRLLYSAAQPIKTMRVWKGKEDAVPLGVAEELYVTLPRGQYDKLQASLTVERFIEAPAQKGQRYGTVNLRMGEQTIAERPLVALQEVPEGNLWRKVVDGLMLMFE
ncbi:MAG: D-alanyl-D-alanine carboxypeptidase family protein [Thiohalomonadaceae bacterium]